MQNFNKQCDSVLELYRTSFGIIPASIIMQSGIGSNQDLKLAIDRLTGDGFINNMANDLPLSHVQMANFGHYITGKGYAFLLDGGYKALQKRVFKERKRFDFEYFKLGYEMVVALFALAFSAVSLYVAAH